MKLIIVGRERNKVRIIQYQEMSWTYNTLSLEKGKDLADWESGVVNRQIDNISKGIREHTSVQVYSLIAAHQ